jgi:cytochrome c-type biogenesis protein CcmH/NrfG
MSNELTTESAASPTLKAAQVYGMAALCLALGLAIGYFFRASQSQVAPAQTSNAASPAVGSAIGGQTRPSPGPMQQPLANQPQSANVAPPSPHGVAMGGHMPSLEEMKQMADQKAAPLLDKLTKDPNNPALLDQVGAIYYATHQFKESAAYYDKAVQAVPKSIPMRTKYAISLDRSGDVDGAIAQLNRALSLDPNDANSLFDLGMIKLQGKQDAKGALAAWQQLLKSNPQLSSDRRATVQRLMANVLTTMADQHAVQGANK